MRQKLLLACGILGGLWAVYVSLNPGEASHLRLTDLVWPGSMALIGVLAIMAVVLRYRGYRFGVPLIWGSAIILGVLSIPFFPRFLGYLVAFILVLVAALGLRPAVRRSKHELGRS